MKILSIRKLTDILMFVAMCFLTGTGLLIHDRLVPGFRGGHGLTLLGFSRHEWGTCRLWAAYFLLGLILVHLILNYTFIKNCLAAKRTWIVIVLGLAGLLVLLFFLLLPLERSGDETQGHGMGLRGGLRTETERQ